MDALKPWLARFDRANLRERVLLFAAAALLMVFIFNLVLVGPEEARSKAHKQRIEIQKVELDAVRKEVRELSDLLARDPNAQQRAQLQGVRSTIAEADALLAQLDSTAPQAAGAVLRQVLGAAPGVELVSLKTLPVTVAFQSKPQAAAPAKPAPAAAAPAPASPGAKDAAPKPEPAPAARPPRTIYRHGIEVSIRGNYLALLPYIEQLQKYPGRLYWTDVTLDVQTYPAAILKLTVYTLSGQSIPRLG